MTSPMTILDIASEAVPRPRRLARTPRLPFATWRRVAERDAEECLALFLAAVFVPGAPESESLAALLFAQGAADAAANRAALDPAARARLERELYRMLADAPARATVVWQRALAGFARTPRGRLLRRGGETALHAWLRGTPPAPRLAALLQIQSSRARATG